MINFLFQKKIKRFIYFTGPDLLDINIMLLFTPNVKPYNVLLATKIDSPLS